MHVNFKTFWRRCMNVNFHFDGRKKLVFKAKLSAANPDIMSNSKL